MADEETLDLSMFLANYLSDAREGFQEMDNALLSIMKGIKMAFDPNNILNPGKIWEESPHE